MKCIVLLSGGVDSTTCLAMAVERYGASEVLALTAYYGQKHAKEIQAARQVAVHYGVAHKETNLSQAFALSDSSLLQGSGKEIRHESYAEQLKEMGGEGTVDTYVPFRNGLFLSYAAATAVSVGAERSITVPTPTMRRDGPIRTVRPNLNRPWRRLFTKAQAARAAWKRRCCRGIRPASSRKGCGWALPTN